MVKRIIILIIGIGAIYIIGRVFSHSSTTTLNKIPASPPIVYEEKSKKLQDFALSGLLPLFPKK